ncbi:MAG: PorT family protein, partial [Cytophagales bacterium]|nr:PorT family protein [Cytophagales bacterium]
MKKTLLLLAAALVLGTAARAQVTVIPKGGLTFSSVAATIDNDLIRPEESAVTYKPGVAAGVGLNVPISKDGFFSVQPELLYVQKGAKITFTPTRTADASAFTRWETYNYLEVPVLGKINFGTGKVKLYVNAGPSLAYMLTGRYKMDWEAGAWGLPASSVEAKFIFREAPVPSSPDIARYRDPRQYNRLDVSLQVGGGAGLAFGPGTLLLDARYGHG